MSEDSIRPRPEPIPPLSEENLGHELELYRRGYDPKGNWRRFDIAKVLDPNGPIGPQRSDNPKKTWQKE